MQYAAGILLAAVICGAAVTIMTELKGRAMAPVKSGPGVKLFALAVLEGQGESLEGAARGLMWLRETGRADLELLVVPAGQISDEALLRARRLCERCGGGVFSAEELREYIEETLWSEKKVQ